MIKRLMPPKELISTLEVFARQQSKANALDFDQRVRNFKRCNEMTFVAYVIKVVCQPNASSPIDPDTVFQVILLSADGDILCLQVHDPNFLIKPAFP